jgi:hypothetical protein
MARPGAFLPIAEDSKESHMARQEGAAPKKNLHSSRQSSQQSIQTKKPRRQQQRAGQSTNGARTYGHFRQRRAAAAAAGPSPSGLSAPRLPRCRPGQIRTKNRSVQQDEKEIETANRRATEGGGPD